MGEAWKLSVTHFPWIAYSSSRGETSGIKETRCELYNIAGSTCTDTAKPTGNRYNISKKKFEYTEEISLDNCKTALRNYGLSLYTRQAKGERERERGEGRGRGGAFVKLGTVSFVETAQTGWPCRRGTIITRLHIRPNVPCSALVRWVLCGGREIRWWGGGGGTGGGWFLFASVFFLRGTLHWKEEGRTKVNDLMAVQNRFE